MKEIFKKFIPASVLRAYHFALAFLGARWYGFPSRQMVVIGILGTRGKTTTANFLWSILTAAGYKTGLTGTANIRIAEREILNPYHMTMPGGFLLQRFLAEMHRAGCEYAIVETPSEGVEQFRHIGIAYDVAVLTTLYPEYLETHGWNAERALAMTLKVFEKLSRMPRKSLRGSEIPKIIIVNRDNSDAERFLRAPADKKITYGLRTGADKTAQSVRNSGGYAHFRVGRENYELSLEGAFNVINALAAIATAEALNIPASAIKKGTEGLSAVPGRMERIEEKQQFTAIVDYAHDAVALETALRSVHEKKRKSAARTILLTGGQGGGRDVKKLPIMGRVAARLADFVVIANEDPYEDDPQEIMEMIARAAESAGKRRGTNLFVFPNRREGIRKALSLARRGDIVLITGKGAEQSMMVKGGAIPWDDRRVVREELQRLTHIVPKK
ncbi:MAG: UDP-N-acetylmuramyl-tripeptide synthetase [Patescibacteria group bacterium]